MSTPEVLLGKGFPFLQDPCEAGRMCVLKPTTHACSRLQKLHGNNSCLVRLQAGESQSKRLAGSLLHAWAHWTHAIYTLETKGSRRSAHATHCYSDVTNNNKMLLEMLVCFKYDRISKVSWTSSSRWQHSARAIRLPSCGEPATVTTSISST